MFYLISRNELNKKQKSAATNNINDGSALTMN